MGDFRWLHFSDLHLETKTPDCDSGTARDRLIDTLKTENFGNRKDLYVFITGDIANKADYTDEQIAWIEEFKEALGVPQESIFWAAGNHDLKRGAFSKYIIGELRDNRIWGLDALRNSSKEDEEKYTQLTIERMQEYRRRYKDFFGRDLTEENLKAIHQLYELKDLTLLVLNTSITSINDDDERKLLLRSDELRSALRNGKQAGTDKPFFAIGHHGLDFLTRAEQEAVEESFSDNGVDVYLCGHAHKPQVRKLTHTQEDIREITCGGGTPNYGAQLVFFYGKYDSTKNGIHLDSYYYGPNRKWKISFNNTVTLEEDNFFYFAHTRKSTILPIERQNESVQQVPWNIDRIAWQMPAQWDPNIDAVVPLDDRNALSLTALLLGNREGYIVFLATTVSKGIGALLRQRERKFADTFEGWKERKWFECEGTEFAENCAIGENAGLVISVKAEGLVKENLWEMIRRWRDKRPQRAVIVNIWAESPYYAVKCAQLAYRYIKNAGVSARVFVAAELGEEMLLGAAQTQALNQLVDSFEYRALNVNECENEEIRELQEYRDEHPNEWVALLKHHAQRRGIPGWICGYRAAYQIHEHVSQWLAAANMEKFFQGNDLAPYIARLKGEELDTLVWEVFHLGKKYLSGRRSHLLKNLEEKLEQMGSESIRLLIDMWDSEAKMEDFRKLEYSEVARWGRASDREHFVRAMEYVRDDKIRRWILLMTAPSAMDIMAEQLMDPYLRRETELILSQNINADIDPELYEEICYIRQEIYKEIYTEEGVDL